MNENHIEQRLAAIEKTQERAMVLLETLSEQVCEQATQDQSWRTRVDLMLHGDGNGHRGLLVRIDRMEQAHERTRWALRAVVAAVLALAGKAAAGLLGG